MMPKSLYPHAAWRAYATAIVPLLLVACAKHSETLGRPSEIGGQGHASSISATGGATSGHSAATARPVKETQSDRDAGLRYRARETNHVTMIDGTWGEQIDATPLDRLSINESGVLLLDGKPVIPRTVGNNSLSLIARASVGKDLAMLIQDNGGAACPEMYRWLILRNGAYAVSNWFGSCSPYAKVRTTTSGMLIVTMADFAGDAVSDAERKRVARKKMTYTYDGKSLAENGKPYIGSTGPSGTL
jgi:hypothetical protein